MQALMSGPNSIQDLIRKAQGGDREAFGQLFESERGRLLERIRGRMGPRLKSGLDPEDLLHDTFLKAWDTVRLFVPRSEDSFFRWLAAIAEHLILNASRKRQPDPLAVEPEPESRDASPSRAMRRQERFDRLDTGLRGLTEEQREAVLLARIDGLSARDIARRTGRSEEAVRQILTRALKRLRQTVGDTESFHLPREPFDRGELDNA